MKANFKATIYKTGINWCVNVPLSITKKMVPDKGSIRIKGRVNGFAFTKTLMPVKNGPYRLFVNLAMMKGGTTALGKMASFAIEQDKARVVKNYLRPKMFVERLAENRLTEEFDYLTPSREKDILKYLNYIKTEETLAKNIDKLMKQLVNIEKNVRIP